MDWSGKLSLVHSYHYFLRCIKSYLESLPPLIALNLFRLSHFLASVISQTIVSYPFHEVPIGTPNFELRGACHTQENPSFPFPFITSFFFFDSFFTVAINHPLYSRLPLHSCTSTERVLFVGFLYKLAFPVYPCLPLCSFFDIVWLKIILVPSYPTPHHIIPTNVLLWFGWIIKFHWSM